MQQALWAPDESESLGTCWGLDPGTVSLALGIHNGLDFVSKTCHLPRDSDPLRRLRLSVPAMQAFLEGQAGFYGPPSLVVIEQPAGTGHNVHPATWYITGATAQAVVGAVDCPVHMVGPTTWKMEALGKGHGRASKAEVQLWARQHGWKGEGEHEGDASVIARCAYIRLARHLGAR